MNKPDITEERLERLLKCLVREFIRQYGHSTHKLSEKVFYLTDRMSCCKEAGLNYEYRSRNREGDVVNVMSSAYVAAVKELAHRGFVALLGNNLTFVLTNAGYDVGRMEPVKATRWGRVRQWANDHQGLIGLTALLVAAASLVVAYMSMPNA